MAVVLIGIVAVTFVMRHKSTEKRSMYSARRSQIEHKVKAARSRTLAPHGRSGKAPTAAEIAATPVTPAYEAPVAPRQAWEVGPATASAFASPPAAAPPAFTPPAYTPGPPEPFTPAPSAPVEEPSWTPAPAEPSWTPTPAPAMSSPAPAEPAVAPAPAGTPAGGGASWEIVGDAKAGPIEERAPKRKEKGKGKDKGKAAAATATGAWQLASGDAPAEQDAEEEFKGPNAAMQIAQYVLLVAGLVTVLIGVLVILANTKVS
ncbi:MAG TPA: hypothetical protein VGV88_09010 [Candidatus Dormibacteraeota bacterium]|nr:hypothetical protein [Candidatus Dormibacteraeota bacterium]